MYDDRPATANAARGALRQSGRSRERMPEKFTNTEGSLLLAETLLRENTVVAHQ
jgi:hypothetical protein